MAKIRKILVPIDFSAAAAGAVRYSDSLAARFDAEVTLLHVAPPLGFDFAMAQPTLRRHQELTAHRDNLLQQAFQSFSGPEHNRPRILAEGDPSEEIVRLAHDDGFDMIVMPTHGRRPLARWLFIGSVTTKVLHQAECAVLAGVDFPRHEGPLALNHILCALDLGPQSEKVLCWGWGLARLTSARLTVVHAAPGAGETASDFFDEAWRSTLATRLRERVGQLQKATGAEGEVVVESGDPHKVVARTAAKLDADLVIIGRGASEGLLGRLRAHAYEIIRLSPCPVVSI